MNRQSTDARNVKPLLRTALLSLVGAAACAAPLKLTPTDAPVVLSRHAMEEDSPATPGPYEVKTLYYGSGADKNRPEYRDSVSIETESVDASKLVSLGESAKSRNDYWGFSPDSFPVNGRVWYPDGDGPFPLVLVVHGNHNMKDFSDPGYDWLGELLASQGYILVSVDMNFINGGIRGENDGRGWMLLKHLQAWQGFNAEGPFEGLVDLSNIGLMGHSRGGEAVAVAAAFNRLTRYPDDASLEFGFDFDIKAVVAIAPVDGQYLPADQRAPVENVNYLVVHGSHDGDVTSFHGLRQFNRVSFTDGGDWFKSAIYVYRANHGQWNTVWGAHDNGPRSPRILDLRGLMPAEDQREFGRVFMGAFLDIALKGNDRYRPLFRDHRVAGDWLPKTMYVTRFMDDSFRPVADFEEDIDVTTGDRSGVALTGVDLGTWKEGQLLLRSSNRSNTSSSQLNQALWLGWNNAFKGSDEEAPPAYYQIDLTGAAARALRVGFESSLELHMAALEGKPGPRENPESEEDADSTAAGDPADEGEEDDEDQDEPPLDLSIQVVDAEGDSAKVRLSDYGPLRRPLETHVLRRADLEDDRFANPWELVLQHFSVPLAALVEQNPRFDPTRLRVVRLLFDQVEAGNVVVDDIGFSRLHPSYLRVQVPALSEGDAEAVGAVDGVEALEGIVEPDPVSRESSSKRDG
ncbi:MAG: chlorophyllase/cutinase-like alpha/beta fold protein [Longimicrobiales bacterium]